jgi:hypothetical protein
LVSSHHNRCNGMLMFAANTKNGLADGTTILNRAGIYFDYNPVVLTNTVEDIICASCRLVIESTNKRPLRLFPNPAVNDITIENSKGFKCILFDIIGKDVYSTILDSDKETLNISCLQSGIYVAQLVEPFTGLKTTIKIVKE